MRLHNSIAMMTLHSYVEPIVFFTRACTYTYFTIESQFVYQFVSESHNFTREDSVSYCASTENLTSLSFTDQALIVADEVSHWTKIAIVVKGIANTVSVLVLTSLSETIGRRNAILFPVVGSLLCSLLLAINIYWRISLLLYVLCAFVYGITGGWVTLINVGTAYLSDTIDKSQRGFRYTLLEICASLGGGLTQLGMGYLLSVKGFIPPTIFITGCSVVALLLTIFLRDSRKRNHAHSKKQQGNTCEVSTLSKTSSLEDSDKSGKEKYVPAKYDVESDEINTLSSIEHDKKTGKKRSTPGVLRIVIQIREVYRIYTSNSIKCGICDKEGKECEHCDTHSRKRVWRLWLYLVTYVVYMAAIDGIEMFITMFLVSYPICFTPLQVGGQTGLEYAISVFAPLLILLFHKLLHFGNQTIILVAISGRILSSTIMFLADSAVAIYVGTTIDVFGHLTTPFIRLQISNLVSPTEQGPGLALVPSVAKLVNIPIQAIILTIYPATLHIGHSFIWVIIGCFFTVSFLLMLVIWIADKFRAEDAPSVPDKKQDAGGGSSKEELNAKTLE